MAGIGALPQVINLPKDTRWEALGEGLGSFAGNIFDAWNTADATQKASQMVGPDGLPDLDKQMVYLQSRLGEKGGKYIEQRMKMQEMRSSIASSQASIRRSDAEIASAKIADKMKTLQLQEEPKKFQMEQALQAAEASAARARAAGVGSEIAERTARTAEIKQNMARQQKEDELTDQLMKGALDTLARRHQAPAATGGGATLQPQSYTVPGAGGGEGGEGTGTIQAPVQRIATSDVVVPGAPGGGATGAQKGPVDESGKPTETSAFSPARVLSVARDAAAGRPTTTETPPVPDNVVMEAVGHLQKKDIAGFYKTLNDAGIGKEIKEMPVPGAPGYFIASAMYPDGKMHPVPGAAPIAKLEKSTETDSRAANGVLQVYNAIQRQKDIGTAGDDGKDPFGGAFKRTFAQQLFNWGWASNDPKATDYMTEGLQSRLGIDTLAAGLRETDKFRELLDRMSAKITDSAEVRASKLQALEVMADISVKARVEDAMASGQVVPPALEQIYLQRGLMDAKSSDLEAGFRGAAKSAQQAEKRAPAAKTPTAQDLGGGFSLTPMGP